MGFDLDWRSLSKADSIGTSVAVNLGPHNMTIFPKLVGIVRAMSDYDHGRLGRQSSRLGIEVKFSWCDQPTTNDGHGSRALSTGIAQPWSNEIVHKPQGRVSESA